MSKAGLFDDRRVELINGDIIEMPAQGHLHVLVISRLSRRLHTAFDPSSYWVAVQGTLRLTRYAAPDPDFHVFGVPEGTPQAHLPLPFLVIEVSDTTYTKDSGPKLRLYARVGVPDYWIVNVPADRVEVYRNPENPTGTRRGWRYADQKFYGRGERIAVLRRPQAVFPVDAILP